MISILYSIFWLIASWRLVKWYQWKLYYPTALFSGLLNLLYEVVCSEYQLWSMEPNGLPNRTLNILLLSLIGMPFSTMIYLSNFPFKKSRIKKSLYIALFVMIFILLEYLAVLFGSITYHNGWHIFLSFLFDIAIFIILFIHFRYPVWAWVLSAGVVLVIAISFNLTFEKMR
ncbi:CBO0543 family protein [Ammoniphilus sp. 3BR4]|uniref:CBO0543 family protein n=1 Tax=Ammoniphilus sp. 3BR4 TaxID=3158265 RepID=UPI0034667A76